jgi:hypothetical protein
MLVLQAIKILMDLIMLITSQSNAVIWELLQFDTEISTFESIILELH